MEGLQRALHVGEVGDDVDEQHDVEGTLHAGEDLRVPGVALHELEGTGAVGGAGGGDGGKGEVEADAARGAQSGQEVPGPAAHVEDALAGGDARPQDARQVRIEVPPRLPRALDPVVVLLVEEPDLLRERVLGREDGTGRSRLGAQSAPKVARGPARRKPRAATGRTSTGRTRSGPRCPAAAASEPRGSRP